MHTTAFLFALAMQDPVEPSQDPTSPTPQVTGPSEPAGAPPPARHTDATPPQRAAFDATAETEYQRCMALVDAGDEDHARVCFAELVRTSPGTEAALKAEVAHVLLSRPRVTPPEKESGFEIPAGRLGVATAVGLFGAWNAVAAGVMIDASLPHVQNEPLVLGTGAAAVVLGAAGGVGGFLLADALALDEGAARLVASGLVWGTAIGIGAAPAVGSLVFDASGRRAQFAVMTDAVLGAVLVSGYLVGASAFALTRLASFDEAQVGMINSGGFVGGVTGLLAVGALTSLGVSSLYAFSGAYLGAQALGLAAGGVLGRVLQLTWGEVLLCDLAGVLGLTAGAALGIAAEINVDHALAFPAPTAAGLLLGYIGGYAGVAAWRTVRGAPVLRGAPDVQPTALAFTERDGSQGTAVGVRARF